MTERSVIDIYALSKAGKNKYYFLESLLAALKDNLNKAGFFRKIKLKRKLKLSYFLKHLSPEKLRELYSLLTEELELNEETKKKAKGIEISFSFQIILVAKTLGIPIEEVWELPITIFREALEFSFLWEAFKNGVSVRLVSTVDKRQKLIEEYKMIFESGNG